MMLHNVSPIYIYIFFGDIYTYNELYFMVYNFLIIFQISIIEKSMIDHLMRIFDYCSLVILQLKIMGTIIIISGNVYVACNLIMIRVASLHHNLKYLFRKMNLKLYTLVTFTLFSSFCVGIYFFQYLVTYHRRKLSNHRINVKYDIVNMNIIQYLLVSIELEIQIFIPDIWLCFKKILIR